MPSELDKNLRKAVSKTDINKLLKIIKSPSMDSIPKDLQDIAKQLGKSIQKKEMGGEVMDMTKSQPVSMMDEGGSAISDSDRQRIRELLGRKKQETGKQISESDRTRMREMLGRDKMKKMNMGGVVPGRGGSFKGVR